MNGIVLFLALCALGGVWSLVRIQSPRLVIIKELS